MKAELIGKKNKYTRLGVSTLEILIAFAILALTMTAVISVVFGNQSIAVDTQTNNEALYKAQERLEDARATSRNDFNSVVSDPAPITDGIYDKQIIVDPFAATECSKQIESKITWSTEANRPQSIDLFSRVVDIPEALALGGDCSALPPGGPGLIKGVHGVNLGGNKTNGLDVFNRISYIALKGPPGLAFVDGTDFNNPFKINNGYDVGSEVNDVDVARDLDTGKVYAYAVRETDTDQLQIIDVTDINNPDFIQNINLPEVEGSSEPEGYRVYYYREKLYVTTKETAGPELHIFDVSNPTANPLPKLGIKDLNRTVNDFMVVNQEIDGITYTLAYMVADSNLKEIAVWNVTPGAVSEITTVNLLGPEADADAYSIFFSPASKLLYVGRQENDSEELFVFDASNPFTGLVERAKNEVGINPLGIRVSGKYLYMISDGSNKDLQIFDADPATGLAFIWTSNNSNKGAGIDYENNYLYTLFNQGSITLQIFHAP